MSKSSPLGIALVVSGPSGSGKSSVCKAALAMRPELRFSVSCATRPPRPGEVDGRDYHFLSKEDFERRLRNGEFLEHAEVHGNFYGTLKSEVESRVMEGSDVLLDIDVQGAMQIKGLCAKDGTLARCAEFLFIAPPSFAELERRLRGRGTETEEAISKRLSNAKRELEAWGSYGFIIVNGELQSAVESLLKLLDSQRLSVKRFKEAPFNG